MAEKKSNYDQRNKQRRKPRAHCVNKPSSVKDVRVNLRRAKFKSKRHSDPDESESDEYVPAPQPETHWLAHDDIPDIEEKGKDFQSLLNAPISADGHFSFKSEKEWNFDISQSSELFSIDLKLLNAAVSCIPFNECIGLDDTYFSKDQLTYIQSAAESAKRDYKKIIEDLSISKTTILNKSIEEKSDDISDTRNTTIFQKNDNKKSVIKDNIKSLDIENLEDDLDFLLTLKEPLISVPTTFPQSTSSEVEEPKCKSASVPTKSVDLEKWLDSVLDV